MNDQAQAPGDPVAEFEAALARRDHSTASGLVNDQPDPTAAFMRLWNLTALGEDTAEGFTFERMREATARSAEKVADAIQAEHRRARTCDGIGRYMNDPAVGAGRVDARDMPWLAYHLVTSESLTRQEDHRVLARAWVSAEYPENAIGADAWRVMFAYADGVVTDLDPDDETETRTARPDAPVRLYRGAVEGRADGMAWTGDRDRAAWFARRWNGLLDDTAHVWTALVDPDRVLARFVHRQEDEYVIDTTGLTIERA